MSEHGHQPIYPLWLRRVAYVLAWMGAALFLTTFVGLAVLIQIRPSVPDAQHSILWREFQTNHYLTSSDTTMFYFALWAVVAVLVVPTYISIRTAKFIRWNEADDRQ